MRFTTSATLFFVVALLAGCAGTRQAADPADALVGTWAYTVETPEGDYSGQLTFEKIAGDLTGTVTSEALSNPADLEDIAFDGTQLTFQVYTPQYGRVSADITVSDDDMSGAMSIPGTGGPMPLRGSRVAGA